MPSAIARILDWPLFPPIARIVLTFPFWASGLSKAFNFSAGVAEMKQFGLEPALAFNIATIVTLLIASVLVIANRWLWLGAGALAVFTALTIPIAHPFWQFTGEKADIELFFVTEHIAMIGGLMLAAILSRREARLKRAVAAGLSAPARSAITPTFKSPGLSSGLPWRLSNAQFRAISVT